MRQKDSGLSRTTGLLLGAALSLVALPGSAGAAPVPWPDEPLAYTVVDQDLCDLLAEIGARLGVRLRVSDAVKARVRGRLPTRFVAMAEQAPAALQQRARPPVADNIRMFRGQSAGAR